jgi:hypothetical protein
VQPTPKVQVQIRHGASLATSAKYQQQEVFNVPSVKQALLRQGQMVGVSRVALVNIAQAEM